MHLEGLAPRQRYGLAELASALGGDVPQQVPAIVVVDTGWASRFGLPYPEGSIGYGQSSDEVGAFVLSDPGLLTGYHEAAHALTMSVLDGLSVPDLSRVVDERWDPPVTAAVRLVSVVNDIGQHLGQAAYVRGLVERRR